MSENQMKFVSWTWIVSVLLGILMLIGGYLLNDTRETICKLQDGKVDKMQYLEDNRKLEQTLKRIEDTGSETNQLIIKHMLRDARDGKK